MQLCEIVRVLGLGDDALLGGGQELEERTVALGRDHRARSRPPAQWVAVGRLDLDHLRPAVGQQSSCSTHPRSTSRDRPPGDR